MSCSVHDEIVLKCKLISRMIELLDCAMENLRSCLGWKKLFLVLDLDQTALNSCSFSDLTAEEEYLLNSQHDLSDTIKSSLYRLDSLKIITKLRPSVHSFLKEASKLFEMYICTMGGRDYALEMAKLLDPGGEYFKSRVITKDDYKTNQKALDVVLGCEESAVLILDDREDVWRKEDKENLILVKGYHFFASSCQQFGLCSKSLSQMKADESEADGALTTILKVLQQIHSSFLDHVHYLSQENWNNPTNVDMKQVLRTVRKQVLKGCNIVISSGVSIQIRRMADQLGAKCSTKLEPSVTHVVSVHRGTVESRWAVSEGKFLVHHNWIQAAFCLWQKQPERNYSVE